MGTPARRVPNWGNPPARSGWGVPQPGGCPPGVPPILTWLYPGQGGTCLGYPWPGHDRGTPASGCLPGYLPARLGWGYPSQGGTCPGYPPYQVRTGGTPARGHPPGVPSGQVRMGEGTPARGAPAQSTPPGQVRTGGYPSQGVPTQGTPLVQDSTWST